MPNPSRQFLETLFGQKGINKPLKARTRQPVRLGIVGCGAIVEFCYLPAAKAIPELEIAVLADKSVARAKRFAGQYDVSLYVEDYRRFPDDLNGVIIALPHYLHAPVTIEFLRKGIPVLVEKPLALTLEEAKEVLEVAEATSTPLQVGSIYRFCRGARLVKQAIEENWLGSLRAFELEGNFADTNPMASGFAWDKGQAGGGTLVDIGSLALDLLCWWLGEPVDVLYKDDSLGGVECECELWLVLRTADGPVEGRIILSRLRKLRNVARVEGEKFAIEYGLQSARGEVCISPVRTGERLSFVPDALTLPLQTWGDLFAEQLRSFVRAISTGSKPIVSGESALPSLALIEMCYHRRQPLELPWAGEEDNDPILVM